MKRIESPKNPEYKTYLSLLTSKGIKKHGLAIVSGEKYVSEAISNPKIQHESILLAEGQLSPSSEIKSLEFENSLFKELDAYGTHKPLLVIKIPNLPTWDNDQPQGINVFLALQDPSNLGAAIRSPGSKPPMLGIPCSILLLSSSADGKLR